MYEIIFSTKFKKDYKLAIKRNMNMDLLRETIVRLADRETLAPSYKDHPLQGVYADCRECHLRPDWLLIYTLDENSQTLRLIATGSHNDLF
ncbi:MAG: type II toxin-antitoxin system YafQ family toxin [Tannerella sp.]|jgi:mRNA interferase YafQ|nr:type II toxin-antitoxin system YafQ family toxin [Tannerella sp.]